VAVTWGFFAMPASKMDEDAPLLQARDSSTLSTMAAWVLFAA
jgi:hypothetical protein